MSRAPIAPLQPSKPGSCPAVDHVMLLKLETLHLVFILASQPSTISLSHGTRERQVHRCYTTMSFIIRGTFD